MLSVNAACRIDALCSFCGRFGIAVLLIVLSACGFLDCCFAVCICFCLFRVAADSFASLYVSEFLIAACGVSPLRGRPKDSALWNPAALERLANFFFWVWVCWCCSPEYKKQNTNVRSTVDMFCVRFCAYYQIVNYMYYIY